MKCLINFSQNEDEICLNGEIMIYEINLLDKIVKSEIIYVVISPGSYTRIRKSIAIVEAIKTFDSKIKIQGINLLKDFGILFTNNQDIFFHEKHITHFFDIEKNEINLVDFSEIDLDKSVGNVLNHANKIIDFSTLNIYNNLDKIKYRECHQEYYSPVNNS